MGLRALAGLLVLFAGAASAQQAVFDTHVHLHDGEASLKAYRADATAAGLELEGMAAMWFGGPHQALQGHPDVIRAGNEGIIALAKKYPEVVPVATVHPYDGQAALDELARVAAKGVRALKLHPLTQQFDVADPRVSALVRRAGELGMVVILDDAGILPGDNQRLFGLALQAPKTQFVFAHIGGMDFRFWNLLALARTADGFFMDNLNFDISATVTLMADSPIEDEFVWTLRNVGIDRVLLGSDYPQFGPGKSAQALQRLDLTAEEKAKIRSGNARRLFAR
ncbi:MAG TPA: amidohydrolase family protein [Pseudoxanthomonas sp.]|nr:amidohydrolase family protein [Pseudoxanthomonas sp.]